MYISKIDGISDPKSGGTIAVTLSELMRNGIPITSGFVITSDALQKFLSSERFEERIKEVLSRVNIEDKKTLIEASTEIKNLLRAKQMPDFISKTIKDHYDELSVGREIRDVGGVALDFIKAGRNSSIVSVRASLNAERLTESVISQAENITGIIGVKGVEEAVKACWASLFSPLMIKYVKENGLDSFPLMGVVVQKMVEADASGITLTQNTLVNDSSKAIVESTWGLQGSIEEGIVTPDVFVIERGSGRVIDRKIGKKVWMKCKNGYTEKIVKDSVPRDKMDKESISPRDIERIVDLCIKVERLRNGSPQKISWSVERGRVYILSSETLRSPDFSQVLQEDLGGINSKKILEGIGTSPGKSRGKVKVVMDFFNPGDTEDMIIVSKYFSPDILLSMGNIRGIITDEGGFSSYSSIVAREMGIPCVVGTENATISLKDGQDVIVNANESVVEEVEIIPEPPQPPAPRDIHEEADMGYHDFGNDDGNEETHEPIKMNKDYDSTTATFIKVNVTVPGSVDTMPESVDGIGLLKAEHILTESRKHPIFLARTNPDELVSVLVNNVGRVAKHVYPKPVWYRAMDARSDEFRDLEGGGNLQESNPLMGLHGIRRSLQEPDIFKCEINALRKLQDRGINNISIMLPFVTDVTELRKARSMIDFPIKMGIMVETPASALKVEEFLKEGVGFVMINFDTLYSLTLSLDPENGMLSKSFSKTDPAVLELIKRVVQACRKSEVEVGICGEAAEDPRLAQTMVELGVNTLSTEMDNITTIKDHVIRAEKRLLLEHMRKRNFGN